jgi:hypothetical protein
MARRVSEKCRRCSKLAVESAKEKDCWAGQVCHVRRSSYRNRDRYNKQRRTKYRTNQGQLVVESGAMMGEPVAMAKGRSETIAISTPQAWAAILHLYRARVGDPLHAIAAELWDGGGKVAVVEPVHTLGWSPSQVQAYLRQVLASFSGHAGVAIAQYEAQGSIIQKLAQLWNARCVDRRLVFGYC